MTPSHDSTHDPSDNPRATAINTLLRIASALDRPLLSPDGAPIPPALITQARLAAIALLRFLPAPALPAAPHFPSRFPTDPSPRRIHG
ncbi:MAG: hypothetical protein KF745_11870 [Phycisphaeraceae bacterium]|nr:hypothetical protein [Phycisphaeraceae bacterium]